MPRQWKLIALYMVIVYLVFLAAIHIAREQVDAENAPGVEARRVP